MQEVLQKLEIDLSNTEGNKQYFEQVPEKITNSKNDASESWLKAKQELLSNFLQPIEPELCCSICSEFFVMATTLNCGHTFCHSCIVKWMEEKKNCPICRTRITCQNGSIALENFIDRIVENQSVEMKNQRQEVVEERKVMSSCVQELLGPESKPGPSHEPQRRHRRRRSTTSSDGPEDDRKKRSLGQRMS